MARLGVGHRADWLFGQLLDARLSRRTRRRLRRLLRKASRVTLNLSLLGLIVTSMLLSPLETGIVLLLLILIMIRK